MRLSTAIRLGAMLKPQGTKLLHADGRTCALGAALDAIGKLEASGEIVDDPYATLVEEWPELHCLVVLPTEPTQCGLLRTVVAVLNDFDGWSRERIADWVAGLERQRDASAAADTDVVTDAVLARGR